MQNLPLAAAALLGLFAAQATAALPAVPDTCCAIAYSPSASAFNYASGNSSQEAVDRHAVKSLKHKDATVIGRAKNGWLVLVRTADGRVACGSDCGVGGSKVVALQRAKDAVAKLSTREVTQYFVMHSRGTPKPELHLLKASAPKFKAGQDVRALWKGNWYDAHILQVKGDKYQIGYTGYGAEWNEWVTDSRLAPRAAFKAGQGVRAEWKGAWYNARVTEVKGGRYLISYDGYGKEWDEWVDAARLRGR